MPEGVVAVIEDNKTKVVRALTKQTTPFKRRKPIDEIKI